MVVKEEKKQSKEKETSIININLNSDTPYNKNNEEIIANSEDSDFIQDNGFEFNNSDNLEKLINKFDNLDVANNEYNNDNISDIIDKNLLLPLNQRINIKLSENKNKVNKKSIIYPKKKNMIAHSKKRRKNQPPKRKKRVGNNKFKEININYFK